MRAIQARYRRQALAEQRAANADAAPPAAERRAAQGRRKRVPLPPPPAPSAAGLANLDRWRQRHPQAARAERELRVDRATDHKNFSHLRGPTVETAGKLQRARPGAIARLWQSEAIDRDQLAAAHAIAEAARVLAAPVAVRTASLETRIDGGGANDAFFEALGKVRAEIAYAAWRGDQVALGRRGRAVLAIVVEDVGLAQAAADARVSARAARAALIAALDAWPRAMRAAIDTIDPEWLDARHAAIS